MASPVPRASAPRRLARMWARRPRTWQRRARQRRAPTSSPPARAGGLCPDRRGLQPHDVRRGCGRDARAPGGGHGRAVPQRHPHQPASAGFVLPAEGFSPTASGADAGETPAHPAAPGVNLRRRFCPSRRDVRRWRPDRTACCTFISWSPHRLKAIVQGTTGSRRSPHRLRRSYRIDLHVHRSGHR